MAQRARRLKAASAKRPRSLPAAPTGPAGGELRFSGLAEVSGRCPGFAAKPRAWAALLGHYLARLGWPRAGVGLAITSDQGSRALNERLRGLAEPTDILSFPAFEGRPPLGWAGHLGDLSLNLEYAWRRRGRFARAFEAEAAFLVLHGLLHLGGWHHDTAAQEKALWRLQDIHFPPPAPLLAALKGLRLAQGRR